MRRLSIVPVFLVSCCLHGACSRPEVEKPLTPEVVASAFGDRPAVLDLAELLPLATVWSETDRIDFGTPEARRHLLHGWGPDERSRRRTFLWAVGESSELELHLERTRTVRLRMVCWPYQESGSPEQRMAVHVNGHRVDELTLDEPKGSAYSIDVPERFLRAGPNRLEFRYSYARRPEETGIGSRDQRALAVGWDRLELEGLRRAKAPHRDDESMPGLFVPAGSRIVYSWRLHPETRLVFDGLRPKGGPEGAWGLRVTARVDGKEEQVLFDGRPNDGKRELQLAVPAALEAAGGGSRPAQLSLAAWSTGDVRGVELIHPRLVPAAATQSPDSSPPRISPPAGTPDIVLYVIDTLRSDHLGCYGYDRPTSPNIDAFAREGVLFERARAQSSWTRPAMASVFTGLYAHGHGVHRDLDAVAEELPVLAEELRAQGYFTAAVVTNGVVSADFGFARGFDRFEYLGEDHESREIHRSSLEANAVAQRILDERPAGRPLFLYVHTTDPHAPYQPPVERLEQIGVEVRDYDAGRHERVEDLTRGRVGEVDPGTIHDLVALYDGEIALNDHAFGELLSGLRAAGLYDDSWIVLLSDHGEEFQDHGRWQHGLTLYEEQLRVPLLVRPPGGAAPGRRVAHSVGQVDVLPTLLAAAGAEIPSRVQGRSLLPLVLGPADAPFEPSGLFAELARHPEFRRLGASQDQGVKSIRNEIYDVRRPRQELFDLDKDPGERVNLAAERPVLTAYLVARQKGSRLATLPPAQRKARIDRELEDNLRALGYLQ